METLEVYKIGSEVINNPDELEKFLKNFSAVKSRKILIHGGGRVADHWGEKMGLVSRMIDGRRVTKESDLDLICMVYAGLINKKIVAGLQALGVNAMGLSGVDGNLISAQKRNLVELDYGWVGDIKTVNPIVIQTLFNGQFVPVIAPLVHDNKGQLLNVNADAIAAELAIGLSALYKVNLSYLFAHQGVLAAKKGKKSVMASLSEKECLKMAREGEVYGGMLPKLSSGFEAKSKGKCKVFIGNNYSLFETKSCTELLSDPNNI